MTCLCSNLGNSTISARVHLQDVTVTDHKKSEGLKKSACMWLHYSSAQQIKDSAPGSAGHQRRYGEGDSPSTGKVIYGLKRETVLGSVRGPYGNLLDNFLTSLHWPL